MVRAAVGHSSQIRQALRNRTSQSSNFYSSCPVCLLVKSQTIRIIHTSPNYFERRSSISPLKSSTRTRSLHSLEQTKLDQDESATGYNFGRQQSSTKNDARKTQIRQSLRAWSLQNEHIKQQDVSSGLPVEGRIRELPQALFRPDPEAAMGEDLPQSLDALNEEEAAAGDFLIEPGTIFMHEGQQYAVYLGRVGNLSQIVLQTGRWALGPMSTVRASIGGKERYHFPGFLTLDEVSQLRACLPQESIRRSDGTEVGTLQGVLQGPGSTDAVAMIRGKFQDVIAEIHEFDRRHGTDIDAAYDKVSHQIEWRVVSFNDYLRAAGIEHASLTNSAKMAIINRLSSKDTVLVSTSSRSLTLFCCPRDMNSRMLKVVEWSRSYQDAAAQAALGKDVAATLHKNPLSSFIDKARRLILKSRKIRTPTINGGLGPSLVKLANPRAELAGETLSDSDKMIVDYLWNSVYRRPKFPRDSEWKMPVLVMLILRAVGAYPNLELDGVTGRLLMKELGCAAPWVTRSSTDLALPLPDGLVSREADTLQRELETTASDFLKKGQSEIDKMDRMLHLRKNWGDVVALSIDRTGTAVREDAVSLEDSTEMPGAYWIHSHVSHATSFFDSKSIIARKGKYQGISYFAADNWQNFPLVPAKLGEKFSLDSGKPCLTISTLITRDGRVHDHKITPGLLGQMQFLTTRAVQRIIGRDHYLHDQSVLVVGKVHRDNIYDGSECPEEEIEAAMKFKATLVLLDQLLSARHARRRSENSFLVRKKARYLDVRCISSAIPRAQSLTYEPKHWKGDAGIVLVARQTVNYLAPDEKRVDDLVAQSVRLASETVGQWLADRKIPALFLGHVPHLGSDIEGLQRDGIRRGSEGIVTMRSARPIANLHYNVKAYAGCTSPMRRYLDMIQHYQIDSYLHAQANGTIAPGAAVEDQSILAFTAADIEEYLDSDISGNDTITSVTGRCKYEMIRQAMFRAFHFQEAKLPEIWEMVIDTPVIIDLNGHEIPAAGNLIPFGLEFKLKTTAERWERQAKAHDFIRVKLDLIDSERAVAWATAVGPPTTGQTLLEPLKLYDESNEFTGEEARQFGRDFEEHQKSGSKKPVESY